MNGVKVTKEQIKSEIDKVRDEYLDVLYRIILALEESQGLAMPPRHRAEGDASWRRFISDMYGAMADAPLQRWPEGSPEQRLALE